MFWILATAGCAGSVAWHITLRCRLAPNLYWPGYLLFAGLAVVWFPAVIGMARQRPQAPSGDWRWLVAMLCAAYAMANSWMLPDAPEFKFGVMASGHLIAFYALAAAMLYPPAARRRVY